MYRTTKTGGEKMKVWVLEIENNDEVVSIHNIYSTVDLANEARNELAAKKANIKNTYILSYEVIKELKEC